MRAHHLFQLEPSQLKNFATQGIARIPEIGHDYFRYLVGEGNAFFLAINQEFLLYAAPVRSLDVPTQDFKLGVPDYEGCGHGLSHRISELCSSSLRQHRAHSIIEVKAVV